MKKGEEQDACAFKDPSLPLAVVVAHTRWDEPLRMRHHVTQQLMRWFNVLFIELFPAYRTDGKLKAVEDRLIIYSPQAQFLPHVRLYANEPITHHAVNRSYVKLILKAVEGYTPNTCILVNFSYDFPEILNESVFGFKCYICNDEFPQMHSRSSNPLKRKYQLKLFQYYENQVARRADYCFTPHYPLCDKLLKVNQCVEMLFHAHNCNVVPHGLSYNKSRHIKVAYAGYLHYRLIDSWLKMALDDSDIDLYLIGPLHPNYNIEQFRKYPNFHLISALGEDKLLTKLTEMDVLVIPYHPHLPEVEVLTTTSKLFQYVVTEKPIVISTLPNFIEMPKGIYYKAKDKKDFIYQIKKAFDDDCPEYIQLRKKIAQENHWNKRGDQLHEIIQQALLTA